MKRFTLLATGFVIGLLPGSLRAASTSTPTSDEIEQRIDRVLNNLLPSTAFKNLSPMTFYKNLGVGAVVMINSNEGGSILREIERAIAREYDWPENITEDKKAVKLSREILASFVGQYVVKPGLQADITLEGGKLFLNLGDQPLVELHPESETKCFLVGLSADVTFRRNAPGEIASLTFQQGGKDMVAERKR